MTPRCAHEDAVRAAAARDEWSADLRTHAHACATCADVALVTSVLRDRRPAPVVARDAGVLWLCAKHARRLAAEARLSLAMMAITTIAVTIAIAVLSSFVDWRGVWSTLSSAEVVAAAVTTGAAALILAAALVRGRPASKNASLEQIHM